MLLINGREIKLAIFDMDGLLLDSERIYSEIWRETAKLLGYEMSYSQWYGLLGTNEETERQYLYSIYGADCPTDDFRAVRLRIIDEYSDKHGFPIKKGVNEILSFLHENDVPTVVATSSERKRAKKLLERSGIIRLFSDITCGNEVALGKPDPALFLKAARKAETKPEKCVVFEDSENGIKAAVRAGMAAVCVPDIQPPTEYVKEVATVLRSLDEFTVTATTTDNKHTAS